jgi:hypothetical protein
MSVLLSEHGGGKTIEYEAKDVMLREACWCIFRQKEKRFSMMIRPKTLCKTKCGGNDGYCIDGELT